MYLLHLVLNTTITLVHVAEFDFSFLGNENVKFLQQEITKGNKYQGVKEFQMLARIGCFENYDFQSF